MKWYNTLTIRTKLIIGFTIIGVMVIILAAYSILAARKIDGDYSYMDKYPRTRAELWLEVRSDYNAARRALSHMGVFAGLEGAEDNIKSQLAFIDGTLAGINETLDTVRQSVNSDPVKTVIEKNDLMNTIDKISNDLLLWYNNTILPVTQANLDGDREKVIAIATQGAALSNGLYDDLIALTKESKAVAINVNNNASKTANVSIWIMLVFSIVTVVLGLSAAFFIIRSIRKPLTNATESLRQITESINSAAGQLNSAAASLAQSSSEQAASIEETSATMNQTSSTVQQNTENTVHAKELAETMGKIMGDTIKRAEELIKDMNELNGSSEEINRIVSTITTIAFQTNILALNASVEAVRAGEAGRSFSVVAEEVRGLSQQSSQAAVNTESIIKNNINLTKQNVDHSGAVNKTLIEVGENASKVVQLLNEISLASEEQARGIQQINIAMSQMEKATQSNAAISEESAAAANELKSQADNLVKAYQAIDMVVYGSKK